MSYFQEYGTIDDCIIMVDRDHKPRGFGFVTFRDLSAVDNVLSEPEHYIDGKLVECKKAVPKEQSSLAASQGSKENASSKSNKPSSTKIAASSVRNET